MSLATAIAENLSPRQRAALLEGNDEYLSEGTTMPTWIALRDLKITFRDGSLRLTALGKRVRRLVLELAPS